MDVAVFDVVRDFVHVSGSILDGRVHTPVGGSGGGTTTEL